MMRPFDNPYASAESQLHGLPDGFPAADRAVWTDYDACIAAGKALSRQLRYREAIAAYSTALRFRPHDPQALRLRAGRYLTTLQCELALTDFAACLALGADALDVGYRRALALYYLGRDREAMELWEAVLPLCDDEMGVAVIYWHTLAASRCGAKAILLGKWHENMAAGHHTGYDRAMRVFAGKLDAAALLRTLRSEPEDMEFAIGAYALSLCPGVDRTALLRELLLRDGFWPCFAYLAAWSDAEKNGLSL